MLKFSLKPETGHKLLLISQDEEPFAKVWTYPKSKIWYAAIHEMPPIPFHNKKKRLAFNDALEFVENVAKVENRNAV